MSSIRSTAGAKDVIFDYIHHETSPYHRDIYEKQLTKYITDFPEEIPALVEYSVIELKQSMLLESAVHFVHLLSIFKTFDKAKLLPIVFKCLAFIDRKKRLHQYLYACKCASTFVEAKDIPSNSPLSVFSILIYSKIDDEALAKKLAEGFAEAITKTENVNLPSLRLARTTAKAFSEAIYKEVVVARLDRQLLRSSAKFIPIAVIVLPKYNLDVNDKSIIYSIISNTVSSKPEERKKFQGYFKTAANSYNKDQTISTLITFYNKNTGFEQRIALTSLFPLVNLSRCTKESIDSIINLLKAEKNPECRINEAAALKTAANSVVDQLISLNADGAYYYAILDVLAEATEHKEAIIDYVTRNYSTDAIASARVLLRNGQNLTPEQTSLLSQPTKQATAKLEVLIRTGQFASALTQYNLSPAQYFDFLMTQTPSVVVPFLAAAIEDRSDKAMSDKALLKFAPYVQRHSKTITDRTVVALLAPRLAVSDDSEYLIRMLTVRPLLASAAVGFVGFTRHQFELVRGALSKYAEDPLSEADEHLMITKDAVDMEHPSAEQYLQMKEEIAHPTSKTNLPQLKKRFEKLSEKIVEKQKEIREELFREKIAPVHSAIALLRQHFTRSKKITPSLTSFTSELLKLSRNPLFKEEVDSCLLAAFKRINAYRQTPRTILSIIESEEEELDEWPLRQLVPAQVDGVLLHAVATRLPQLLQTPDACEAFCDVHAITEEIDVETLLPIYLDNADRAECIYRFAVAMCEGVDVSRIPTAFENILFAKEAIRHCAVCCINASNITAEYVTPKLFCQILCNMPSLPEAGDLLGRLEVPPPEVNEILNNYHELLNLAEKDPLLCQDIGVSFGNIMMDDVDEAVHFLTIVYNDNTKPTTEAFIQARQDAIRTAISFAVLELKPMNKQAIDFITLTALKDTVQTVRDNMMVVCEHYIETLDGPMIEELYKRFFQVINLPPVSSQENNNLRICLVQLCTKIIKNRNDLAVKFMDCLMMFNIRSPDEALREISAKTISQLAKKNTAAIDEMYNKLMPTVPNLKTPERLLGFAYTFAALLHAQGITALTNRNVFDFTDELSKSGNPMERSLAAHIFGALSFMYGKLLEPSLPRILPVLLVLYGDPKQEVRESADCAAQSIVKNLTHSCGKRVLPYALKNVENDDNWRIQQAGILFVQSVLKGGRNNATFVPDIVASLSKALKSPNSQVKQSANEALQLLRSNITNEAVNDMFPFLIAAISNTSKLDIAIDKVSHLNLTSLLDEASLALIVPIVTAGTRVSNVSVKSQAIKITGHLPKISIEGALEPFADELIEPLFSMISDASPTIRALAANSLSSIIVVLPHSFYDKIIERLLQEMTVKTAFAERQGYAMAIASLIKTQGVEILNSQLLDFVDKARNNKDLNVRECYVSLLGFLSHFFDAEEFAGSYEITIDAVLDACADPNDAIRTVGLRSASLIAKTFALVHPELILQPYFMCAQKDNWRHRLTAVHFMKAFVLACTGMTEADDKGIRQIGELLEKLGRTIPEDVLHPALMTLFILSNDPIVTVNNEAQLVWRQIIPNTGSFLRGTMDALIERIESFVSSESEIVRAVGASAMQQGVKKVKTRFLMKCFDLIDKLLVVEDIDVQHGALMCIHALDEQMNQEQKLRACTQLAPFLSSPYDLLRNEAIESFVQMRNSLGEEGARQVSSELVKYVYQRAQSPDDISCLAGLLGILGHHSMVQLTYDILKRPLDADRPRITQKLVSVAGPALDPIISQFAERIISMCANPPNKEEGDISIGIASAVVRSISENHLKDLTLRLVENMRSQQPQNRRASILIGNAVLDREGENFTEITKLVIRAALYLFDDPLDEIMTAAVSAIATAGQRIAAEHIEPLVQEICEDFVSICSVTKVRAFKQPDAFDALEPIIEKALASLNVNSVSRASVLLATIVPQLAIPPQSIRKLLALVVRNLQITSSVESLRELLDASRALFEKANSERQMLVNSLPTAYLRLFRESDPTLHAAAAEALTSLATRISTPALIVRLFLKILEMQGKNSSPTLLHAVITTVKKLKLSAAESDEILAMLSPHLMNSQLPMRELAASAISTTLISSPIAKLRERLSDETIISLGSPARMHTSVIIMNDILKSGLRNAIDAVLPIVKSALPTLEKETDTTVLNVFPRIAVSVAIIEQSLIDEMVPYVITLIENGEVEHQVIGCQELQRLGFIKQDAWRGVRQSIIDVLVNGYRFGEPALQSAAGTTLFVLFHLEEQTKKGLTALAAEVGDDQAMDDFKDIITQVQSDRANQRLGKAANT